MKKVLMAVGALACFGLGGAVVAVASPSGSPEIDRAAATMSLNGQISQARCPGEDTTTYETFVGQYSGSQTQVAPATDYSLSGTAAITITNWTINIKTARGVLAATIMLSTPAAGVTYKGALTLITQGLPVAGAVVTARGWIFARFVLPDEGASAPKDDALLANAEFKLSPTAATGQFGSSVTSLGYPDFSVVTNVPPVAANHC